MLTGTVVAAVVTEVVRPFSVLAAQGNGWADTWQDGAEKEEGAPLPDMTAPTYTEKADRYCPGILRLKSAIHGETREFRFRDGAGNYDLNTLASLNWFLRCRDGSWQYMDVWAIETLNYLSALFGTPVMQIVSGYRSPAYNAKLARQSENVARNSLHQYGQAIDFSIPGIPVREVCSYTLYARNVMGFGGVGYYPRAGFVHLDSGKIKQWAR